MRKFLLAIGVTIFSAGYSYADCGDETWVIPPKEIDPAVLSKMTAVATLTAENPAFTQLSVYELKGGKFVAIAKVPVTKVMGVSHAPTCRPPNNPLDGLRIPVFEINGPYVRAALNAKYDSSIWIRPDEFGSQHTVLISSLPKHIYVRTDLGQDGEGLSVYQKPVIEEPHTILPKGYGILGVMQQSGDFIQVGLPYGEGGLRPIGWIRIRDENGRLVVWPWHYDSC